MDMKIMRAREGNHPAPRYAKEGDAGLDFCADIDSPRIIWPLCRAIIPLGWLVEIPPGHVGLIKARSGHAALKGMVVSGGVIDSGYRGEPKVVLINCSWWPRIIRPREKVCQMLILPVATVQPEVVRVLSGSDRGVAGFGSTGLAVA